MCIIHWVGYLMMPLTTIYDEYFDGSKFTAQKTPFEYVVPPPH